MESATNSIYNYVGAALHRVKKAFSSTVTAKKQIHTVAKHPVQQKELKRTRLRRELREAKLSCDAAILAEHAAKAGQVAALAVIAAASTELDLDARAKVKALALRHERIQHGFVTSCVTDFKNMDRRHKAERVRVEVGLLGSDFDEDMEEVGSVVLVAQNARNHHRRRTV
ncbi:hypothetical protein BCR33DRAFT_855919 [Rhizoclosmatium globosum]|uniref:Uncharacterized protein n=1 Tax=Rhizoclosmatium globosum TaxID=329046 RepID=A0A1Y2BI16_9FUNG|nr:hypothetical protein BCR33DRAFT_855919 [Rhizoclosmatium globosum]|eukprot:ORY34423.1 hypothetical protein BCR33DRAFT_855919 [Rhizoclosmatium globosum]